METLKFILPAAFIIGAYLILRVTEKNAKQTSIIIKARILIGCVASGFFLCSAVEGENVRDSVISVLLSLVFFYGAVMLLNKYLLQK